MKELTHDLSTQSDEESDSSESDSDENEPEKKHILKPKKALRIGSRKKTTSKPSFWKDMFKNLYQSSHILKSIEGRAAKVHSFMRGLSMSHCYPFSPFSDTSSPAFDDLDASYSGASEWLFPFMLCIWLSIHLECSYLLNLNVFLLRRWNLFVMTLLFCLLYKENIFYRNSYPLSNFVETLFR